MKVGVIIVAGTQKQNKCFFPSFNRLESGMKHDLLVVHRNHQHLSANIVNSEGQVILENKIINGEEVPHQAFGAYRWCWEKYKNQYDAFAFISDDIILKMNGWLSRSIDLLFKFDRLGWVGSQVMNGSLGQYPHPSHNRAPLWFAKSKALMDVKWDFASDHDGEMSLGDDFAAVGYFGAQVGIKIDVGYDALENGGYRAGDHIVSCWESSLGHPLEESFSKEMILPLQNNLLSRLDRGDDVLTATSPHPHIGTRRVVSQLQPFNGLLYDRSESCGLQYCDRYPFGINILKGSSG